MQAQGGVSFSFGVVRQDADSSLDLDSREEVGKVTLRCVPHQHVVVRGNSFAFSLRLDYSAAGRLPPEARFMFVSRRRSEFLLKPGRLTAAIS